MKKSGFILLFLLILSFQLKLYSKEKTDSLNYNYHKALGLGYGADFGGLGGSLVLHTRHNLDINFSVGYNFPDVGANVGLKWRFPTQEVAPYLICLYGINNIISYSENFSDNYTNFTNNLTKSFVGLTLGFGLDINVSKKSNIGYLNFGILFPINNQKEQDFINELKVNNKTINNEFLNVKFTAGFYLILD